MSTRNWLRAGLLALVIVGGWILSLVWPWAAYIIGCMVGAAWLMTLQAANADAGESSPNTGPKEQR